MSTASPWWHFEYLPVGIFGSVMGLIGTSVAWDLAHQKLGFPSWPSQVFGMMGALDFAVVGAAYVMKAVLTPSQVLVELKHPIAGTLFATIFTSFLLLPFILVPRALALARVCWCVGALCMVTFAWFIVSRWLGDRQQIHHATPAWMVPVVGVLNVPVAMPILDFPPLRLLSIFCLAVGFFFTIPLFTMIFSRLVFEEEMPDNLKATLMILVAPFSVGYSAYQITVGGNDVFSQCLFLLALFMLASLVGELRYLLNLRGFAMSWWAVSFPLSATSIASLRFASANPGTLTIAIAIALLVIATGIDLLLLWLTIGGICCGKIRHLGSG